MCFIIWEGKKTFWTAFIYFSLFGYWCHCNHMPSGLSTSYDQIPVRSCAFGTEYQLWRSSSTVTIGAKRGGTREQCSQKLFDLAEIFRKIIKIIDIFDVDEERFLDEGKISQISPHSKYFLLNLAFSLILSPRIFELLAEIFWESHRVPRK